MAQSFEHAQAGDLVEITGHQIGDHARLGEILEVAGEAGHVRLRVRWDDDRETIFFPGSDASIKQRSRRR
ncbi:MAG: DUF1918 domain-containing protein [Microvirga sp.]|jgi:hypothetical protein